MTGRIIDSKTIMENDWSLKSFTANGLIRRQNFSIEKVVRETVILIVVSKYIFCFSSISAMQSRNNPLMVGKRLKPN